MHFNSKNLHGTLLLCLFVFFNSFGLAQTNSDDAKAIWENPKNPDSLRFSALNQFYELNTPSSPDLAFQVSSFHFQLAKKKNNKKEMIKALSEKSYIYFLKDSIGRAEEFLEEAVKIQNTINDFNSQAFLYANLASVYKAQSKLVKAIEYYNYALKILKAIKNQKSEAHVLSNLGLMYFDLKNNEVSLDYYERALRIYEKLKLRDNIAYTRLGIGAVAYETGDYKQSIKQTKEAAEIFKENKNQFFLAECYALLAKCYQKINELENAFAYIDQSLSITQQLEVKSRIIQDIILKAELYLGSEPSKARMLAEQALGMSDGSTNKYIKASLYNLLYKCYQKEGKLDLSHAMYEQYIVYNDSIIEEQSDLNLVKEAVNQEFKIKLNKAQLSYEKSEKDLKRDQFIKILLIISACLILVAGIYFYARNKIISNAKIKDELLEEIARLKLENNNKLVVNAIEFQLNREAIERSIQRKLNETDWNVLTILLKEPEIANKEIAEKAFMSVDGIGSSLRRMYGYFDVKESKYKKISLIMEAIKASNT
jgi:tetratricopeptide (TPR) repeat protein